MQTARLTSKGQLVIPKPIRDVLHLGPGTDFNVSRKGSRIVLEARRSKPAQSKDCPGLNPKGVKLSLNELCAPVNRYKK